MAECECLKGCLFFNDKMKKMKGVGTIYKQNYCKGDNSKCARYMVFKALGKTGVPANLYPNQYDEANEILIAQ